MWWQNVQRAGSVAALAGARLCHVATAAAVTVAVVSPDDVAPEQLDQVCVGSGQWLRTQRVISPGGRLMLHHREFTAAARAGSAWCQTLCRMVMVLEVII